MPILHYPQAAKNNGHDHLQTGFALLPPLWWEEEKRVERQGLSTCVRKLSYHFEYLFFWSGIYLVTMNFQLFPGLQSRFSSCLLLQCFCWGTRAWSFLFYLFLMSFQISTAALFFIISSILMYLCTSNSLPSYLRCKAFWNVIDCQWRRDMISTQCDKYHERSLQSMTKLARVPGSKLRTVPLTVFALLVSFLGNVHWETGRFGFHDFPGFIALSGTDNVFSTQKN